MIRRRGGDLEGLGFHGWFVVFLQLIFNLVTQVVYTFFEKFTHFLE